MFSVDEVFVKLTVPEWSEWRLSAEAPASSPFDLESAWLCDDN